MTLIRVSVTQGVTFSGIGLENIFFVLQLTETFSIFSIFAYSKSVNCGTTALDCCITRTSHLFMQDVACLFIDSISHTQLISAMNQDLPLSFLLMDDS
jgi:hypothetical protein